MTKRIVVTALAVLMLLALAVPASASGGEQGPVQTCKGLYETREQVNPGTGEALQVTAYWVPLEYPDGTVEDLAIQTLLGCATTVHKGGGTLPVPYDSLTIPAYNGQCRYLEQELGIVSYPYDFYGNPEYHAENRADCIYFLRSFHLGLLPPGPPA